MNDERRVSPRSPTSGSVRFVLAGRAHFGTMRNLSQLGCMIEAPELSADLAALVEVTLTPDYVINGRIAWLLGGAMGIAFHHPIPTALVRHYALDDWPLKRSGRQRIQP